MEKALLITVLVAFAMSAPVDFTNIEEYIPPEVMAFYKSLTPEDHDILKTVDQELTSSGAVPSEEEILGKLKEKSQSLYDKLVALNNTLYEKISALSDEPRNFLIQSIEKVRNLRGNHDSKVIFAAIKEIISNFQSLSESAKTELGDAFPTVRNFIQSDLFKKMSQMLTAMMAKALPENGGMLPNPEVDLLAGPVANVGLMMNANEV